MNNGSRYSAKAPLTRRLHFSWQTFSGLTLSLLVATAGISWLVRLTMANPPAEKKGSDAALAATANSLLKNAASPKDPEEFQAAAANLFVILHPELAHEAIRQDPDFVAAENAAAQSLFNPGAAHRKKMQDPKYRQNYHAAMESFKRDARKAERPIPPSATDARQIERLRNDPEWRRQREDPIRALLPKPE